MKYIIGFVVTILIFIVAIVAIANRGDDGDGAPPTTVELSDYIDRDRSEVRYAVSGKIVSEEEHREVHFVISADKREVQIIQGYQNTVLDRRELANNHSAYAAFIESLEKAGFISSRDDPRYDSPAGTCPTGKRYTYELREAGDEVVSLWGTSCSRTDGTFAGRNAAIERLFKDQFPEYERFARDVRL